MGRVGPAAKDAMAAFSPGLLSSVLVAALSVPAATHAADPAPAAPPAATSGKMAAAAPALAATDSASASVDQAVPVAPEPLLVARLEAKTLAADFIKLGDDAQPFLARFRAATQLPAKGAVLFIPTPGQFIGDDAVIAAALVELPAGGWTVLAVQTPLLPAVASVQQYADSHDLALARAKTALEYLTQQHTPVSLVVGRAASIELAREVATSASEGVALVALGPWLGPLGTSKSPLFDVSPDRDRVALARARERYEEAGRLKLGVYKQVVLSGADWRLLGFETEIARRIRGFAEHLPAPGKAAPPAGS